MVCLGVLCGICFACHVPGGRGWFSSLRLWVVLCLCGADFRLVPVYGCGFRWCSLCVCLVFPVVLGLGVVRLFWMVWFGGVCFGFVMLCVWLCWLGYADLVGFVRGLVWVGGCGIASNLCGFWLSFGCSVDVVGVTLLRRRLRW